MVAPMAVAAGLKAAGTVAGALLSKNKEGRKYRKRMLALGNQLMTGYEGKNMMGQPLVREYDPILKDMEGFNQYFNEVTGTGPTQFFESPGYQFRKQEGLSSVNQASIAGGRFGGARLKALTEYGSGLASQEYGSYMDRLRDLAGIQVNALRDKIGLRERGLTSGLSLHQAGIAGSMGAGMQNAGLQGQAWAGLGQGLGNIVGSLAPQKSSRLDEYLDYIQSQNIPSIPQNTMGG